MTKQALGIILALPWLVAAPLSAQSTGDKDNGKKVFEKIGCWQCHGYAGQGGAAGAVLTATKLNAQGVIRYVRRPAGVMAAYTERVVSDQELTDVFAYIKSIPPAKTIDQIPLLKEVRDAK
jgi:mono/diheme cytochrome c family protein